MAFDEVLPNSGPVPERPRAAVTREGLVVDGGAGAVFLPHSGSGPLIGLHFGYLAATLDSSWDYVSHWKATGGSGATIAGPYVRVTAG